jgi:1,4-alpha-glucan branching enzyme
MSAIPTEVKERNSHLCERVFTFRESGSDRTLLLDSLSAAWCEQAVFGGEEQPAIRFAVWVPNAQNIELVRGTYYGPPSGRANVYSSQDLEGSTRLKNGRV